MTSALYRILSIRYAYSTLLDRQRARSLYVAALLLTLGWLAFAVVAFIPRLLSEAPLTPTEGVLAVLLPILGTLVCYFVQTGRLQLAIWLFIGALYAAALPVGMTVLTVSLPVLLVVPVLAAGILLNQRGFTVVALLVIATLIVRALIQNGVTQPVTVRVAQNTVVDLAVMLLTIALSAVIVYAFSGNTRQLSAVSVEDVQHLRVVSAFVAAEEESDLLIDSMHMLQADLGYVLAQVFLISDDQTVQRRVRLGIRQNDLTSSTIVNPGNVAAIRQALETQAPVLVSIHDGQTRASHLTVGAVRALVVPVVASSHMLGVLDIQSAQRQPFSANQIETLRAFGQRLGAALYRARVIADLRQAVQEREEAAAFMRSQLAELQGRSHQTLFSGWNKYLQTRGQMFGYDLDRQHGSLVPAADLPPEILAAFRRGEVFVEKRDDAQIVNAPILIRGDVLGAMSFKVPLERAIGEREIELLRTVSSRLGIALENNRLLEQTQAQARRERTASEVANTLLTATSIESLMDLAAENFNEALDAVYTRIYLEPGVVTDASAARGEPA